MVCIVILTNVQNEEYMILFFESLGSTTQKTKMFVAQFFLTQLFCTPHIFKTRGVNIFAISPSNNSTFTYFCYFTEYCSCHVYSSAHNFPSSQFKDALIT